MTVFLLIQFDNTRETVVETNFLTWCIGGTLFQYIDGIFRLCVYIIKKNSPAECNYEIYDKKMLTIIRCFEKWDIELRNVKFEIRIGHKNLEYFMTVKKLTERQIKWFFILFEYDFVINYITSKNNERTDASFKREQNVPEAGDDKLEYKMAQLLKPGMFNFKEVEFEQSKTSEDSPQAGDLSEFNHPRSEKQG